MTTITLQQYHEQINQLLEDSQYDLAVEHCRHILQQQPQHVATYRLLAKTLLERGDYDGARELFQRVLSADPNDHIAHAGLAIIFKEEEVPAQAIWHLERAYEIEPYNTAIQQELRALYTNQIENRRRGQKNGDTAVIPTTLLLTKGALARLYLRGELYDQATAVLRTALSADEERIDLRVLLMEALWRDGRRIEAVNVALQVLDQLPNCIMANAVLAEIWLRTGRVDEAQGYLQRLQDMLLLDADHFDPEAPEGSAFRAEGAIPLPKVVELDYLGAEGAMAEFEGPSTWTPGPAAEAEEPEAEAEDDMYQWLTGLTGELPPLEEAEASDQAEQTVTYESGLISATEPTSDWLDDLLAEDEESDLEMAAGSVQSQKEPQNKRVTLFPSAADETIPEWLAEDEEDETEAEASPPPAAFPPAVEADEFAPDWLADLAGDDLEPMEVDAQTAAAWLRENEQIDEEREEADSDAFDWLDTPLADSQDVMVDSESGVLDLSQFAGFQMDLDEVEEEEDDFEWRLTDELNALSTGSQEEAAHLPEDVEEQDELGLEAPADIPDDLPDWLMTGSVTGDLYEEKQSASDELAEELADWVAANSPELPAEEDFADWQPEDELDEDEITLWDEQEVEPAEAEATLADDSSSLPDSGDLPAWLSSEAVPDSVDSRLLGTSQFSEDVPDDEDEDDEFLQSQIGDELPGWLQDDSTAVADEQERISTGDLPAWLRGAGLEAVESSPLEEPVVAEADDAALAGDAQADTFPGETPETPKFSTESDLLRAAAELDLSTQEELAAADDLPGWLFADEELVESERAESPDVDVEAVMGDENEEKYTGPEDEQATQPEQLRPSDEEMDW
ncbi:MAG: tetratricopeptide repeat protein, partial [Anaerolineales bacterium]|nr:tetratricopeptide repeat protein [Anaerolineales bacterium]